MFPQNQYPNGTNYPYPSFPEAVPPPDEDPFINMKCVRYNPAWAAVLMSAVSQLIQLSTWAGTDDEKKLAASRACNLQAQLQQFEDCDMGCCGDPFGEPVLTRVTDDGTIEVSNDGGATWVTDATDPRLTQPSLPTITGDGDLSCQAASNITAAFKPIQASVSALLTGTIGLLALSAAISVIIAAIIFNPIDAWQLVPVLIRFAVSLVSETSSSFDGAFTDEQWHDLTCAIKCTIGTDGVYDLTELAALRSQLSTFVTDPLCLNFFDMVITGIGLIGMNNMGSQHATEEDCTDCPCADACNLDQWQVLTGFGDKFGTITSRDESTGEITIETTNINTNGLYYVDMSTSQVLGADTGCYWVSPNSALAYQLKGEAFSIAAFHTGFVENQCVNHIQASASAPFSLTITFGACP